MKNKNICIVKGCDRKIAVIKHGLCKPHVNQLYKRGEVTNKPLRKNKYYDKVKFV